MEDIESFLEDLGYDLKDYGNHWRTTPLYRDSNNSTVLIINKDDGASFDFKTKQSFTLKRLAELTLGKEIEGFDLEKFSDFRRKPKVKFKKQEFIDKSYLESLIEDYTYFCSRKNPICKEAQKEFEGRLCLHGEMKNRMVFPVYDKKDRIIGLTGRDVTGRRKGTKWYHYGKTSLWHYPLHKTKEHIISTKRVFLVEGPGDGLNLWQHGFKNFLVCPGANFSNRVFRELVAMNVNEIVFLFDNDDGGISGIEKAKGKLDIFFPDCVKVILPPKDKDIGEHKKQELKELLKDYV